MAMSSVALDVPGVPDITGSLQRMGVHTVSEKDTPGPEKQLRVSNAHAIAESLQRMGAQTMPAMHAHVIEDAHGVLSFSAEQLEMLAHMRSTPDMCLCDTLLGAYVLNGGLVMCCQGSELAVHLAADPQPFVDACAAPAALEAAAALGQAALAAAHEHAVVAPPMQAALAAAPVHAHAVVAPDLLSFEAELDALADACDCL